MAANTKISWCDHTWGPWRGCTKVSEGCVNCYAETWSKRWGHDFDTVTRTSKATWHQPLATTRKCEHELQDRLPLDSCKLCGGYGGLRDFLHVWASGDVVFVCQLGDFCHEDADEWRQEAWDVMRQRPDLHWIILTKRPEKLIGCLPPDWVGAICPSCLPKGTGTRPSLSGGYSDPVVCPTCNGSKLDPMDPYCGWPNVTLMVTGENQKRLTERYAHLRRIPAAHYGVSLEPLLGAIDLAEACPCPGCGGEPVWEDIEAQSEVYYEGTDRYTCDHCNVSGIDPRLGWVIVGGESGKNARAIDLDAVRSLRDQCEEASIPFAFKQIGPKGAGNVLDGVVHEGVPERAISANGRKHSQAAG